MAELEERAEKLLPEFHPVHRKVAREVVECSLCCALVVNLPGARNHHARFHVDLWRVYVGVRPFTERDTAEIRSLFEEIDRG